MPEPTRPAREDLPEALAARPWDEKRDLPIPLMNTQTDPETGQMQVDFTGIFAQTVYDAATARRCGICGEPLDYWIAFVGGPKSYASRSYVDPPFCVPCALAATRLCPHLAIRRHKRAPEHRLAEGSSTPEGFVEEKPEEFIIGITRDYKVNVTEGHLIFKAAPFKKAHRFRFDDEGHLTEITEAGQVPR